jgi:hypothetical protein
LDRLKGEFAGRVGAIGLGQLVGTSGMQNCDELAAVQAAEFAGIPDWLNAHRGVAIVRAAITWLISFAPSKENPMNKLIAPFLAASLAMTASTAFAGGPVVIVEEGQPEVIAEKPASSVGILPLLLIPIILCVALCGGGDDE